MAMPCPRAAILPRPTGRATVQIDQVKLTPVTVLIIRKKAGQNALGIRTLLQALKATNPQIRIGVGLGGDGTNPGADVGDGGSCLLYTSPSPRDKRQSRMPSSA